jgi:hypothetical protein
MTLHDITDCATQEFKYHVQSDTAAITSLDTELYLLIGNKIYKQVTLTTTVLTKRQSR